jgi:hypothetical protein
MTLFEYTTLAGLQVVGLIANVMVRPVADKWFMPDAALSAPPADPVVNVGGKTSSASTFSLGVALARAAVVIPMLWGVSMTFAKVSALFS